MCSILVTNKKIRNDDLNYANYFSKFRGPDYTGIISHKGTTFLHNLLSITGDFTPEPFFDEKNEIIAVFNGEIYNYKKLGDFTSDGNAIIPLYSQFGADFIKKLDGEYAIVLADFGRDEIIISPDVFRTKPLFMAKEGAEFGISTYQSSLTRLGFNNIEKVEPNHFLIYKISDFTLKRKERIFNFDANNQIKDNFEDFFTSFEESIQKRTANLREKIFIGLSSGYDSGAIACELLKQKVDFKSYSIVGQEDEEVLMERAKLVPHGSEIIDMDYSEYSLAKFHLKLFTEEFRYPINENYKTNLLSDDSGAIGLSAICKRAKEEGIKIYLSGQGADEIFSDYGQNGEKLSSHSTFGGIFPIDLQNYFPWRNFFKGAQEAYLAKEEYVSGSYGIEGRYPFLDPKLVREFLWLKPELKNAFYKNPLREYLKKNKFPFKEGYKKGFLMRKYGFLEKITPKALIIRTYFFLRRTFNAK